MAFRRNSPGGCTSCGCTPPGGGGPGGIPGCVCQGTPGTLSVVASYSGGRNAAYYSHTYQDCTLQWYTATVSGSTFSSADHPSYLPAGITAYNGPGYYSTTSWFDDFGQENSIRLTCFSTQFTLYGLYFNGTSWAGSGNIRRWSIGTTSTCVPFLLLDGVYPGDSFLDKVTVSG